ncbi:MAG: CoA-binding protein [Trichormus sp.]
MSALPDNDDAIREILAQAKTIAIVGHSDRRDRVSYQVAQFLRNVGYIVYPVNPLICEIDSLPCYPALEKVPQPIDIVNIFRRSEYLPEIVDAAIAIRAKTIWGQLGIYHQQSAKKAQDAGLNLVMDSCIKVEYLRLNVSQNNSY